VNLDVLKIFKFSILLPIPKEAYIESKGVHKLYISK